MFSGSSKVHILLIDAEGANLLQWNGRRLSQIRQFVPDQDDFDSFHLYFEGHARTPCILVTDFIEEDFRTETTVHVTGSDRNALLNRRMSMLFRNTPYRIARVIGRETTGRKDDKVLFTALTKPDIIEPWISRLLRNRVSVTALTSAAFVMEEFAQHLKLRSVAHLLLVNRESRSGLRQTYLQKGRVVFSRLTRSGEMDDEGFSRFLLEQCDQTRKYLERIKQLPYDTGLEIHVLTNSRFTDLESSDHEQLHFHYYALEEMRRPAALDLPADSVGAVAFSLARGLKKGGIRNVYAPLQIRRYSFIRRTARYLYGAGALAVACTLIFLSPTLLSISEQIERETQMNLAAQPLLSEYERLRENFPETPIQSGQMELVVSTYETILAQEFNATRSLALISEALTASPELVLLGIQWDIVAPQNQDENVSLYGSTESEEQQFQRALVSGQMQLVTRIQGMVESASSYRQAREMISRFSDALSQRTGSTVTPLSMPMDVSVDTLVTAVVDGSNAAGEFTLMFSEPLKQ